MPTRSTGPPYESAILLREVVSVAMLRLIAAANEKATAIRWYGYQKTLASTTWQTETALEACA